MKRSLAPPRRDKPAGSGVNPNPSNKKILLRGADEQGPSKEKLLLSQKETESGDKIISEKFEERYRNKNLNALPTPLLVTLSTLSTLDISYNKLSDSQIELIMNSCTKLSTLCIEGNVTTIIPSSISKLKLLVNFRHDWLKLGSEMYEPEQKLNILREISKNPNALIKSNRISGIDFSAYCEYVLERSIDNTLCEKIGKCDCTQFAKDNMLKQIDEAKLKPRETIKILKKNEAEEKKFIEDLEMERIDNRHKELPTTESNIKELPSEAETDVASVSIQSKILPYSVENLENFHEVEPNHVFPLYNIEGMPLHSLFSNFDSNPQGPAEIDGLLLKGYNPNIYDSNGLSPFHICVAYKQKKGLEYLLEISSNNPGFFDLEIPSIKEGRNILHESVSIKNYQFTKMLVDFGLPIDKRDASGARLLHLVDQNYEFLILLRKLFRKRTNIARSITSLTVPPIPHHNKRSYIKHPQRQREESRFRITYSRNDKLLELYEAAAGIPK